MCTLAAACDGWRGQAYAARIDPIDVVLSTHARDRLGATQSREDMYRVFARFNVLRARPRVRIAIEQFQKQVCGGVTLDFKLNVLVASSTAVPWTPVLPVLVFDYEAQLCPTAFSRLVSLCELSRLMDDSGLLLMSSCWSKFGRTSLLYRLASRRTTRAPTALPSLPFAIFHL